MAGDAENRFFRSAGSASWMKQKIKAPVVRRPPVQQGRGGFGYKPAAGGQTSTPPRPISNTATGWTGGVNPYQWMKSQFPTNLGQSLAQPWQNVGEAFQQVGENLGLYNPPTMAGFTGGINPLVRYGPSKPIVQRINRSEGLNQFGVAGTVNRPYAYTPPGIGSMIDMNNTQGSQWAIDGMGFPYLLNTPKTGTETYGGYQAPADYSGYGGGGGGGDYTDYGGGGGGGSYTPEPPRWYMNMLSWNIQRKA